MGTSLFPAVSSLVERRTSKGNAIAQSITDSEILMSVGVEEGVVNSCKGGI